MKYCYFETDGATFDGSLFRADQIAFLTVEGNVLVVLFLNGRTVKQNFKNNENAKIAFNMLKEKIHELS